MKRFWIGIFLLALAVGLCITEHSLTKSMSDDITYLLNDLGDAANQNDNDAALNLNDQLNDSWQNFQKPMSMFISHDILSDMSQTLAVFEPELQNQDYARFDDHLALAQIKISDIEDNEKLSIGNLL